MATGNGYLAMDNCQWALLHHACLASPLTADSVALAEYLLSRGASVNHGDGGSALHILVVRPSTSYSTDMIGLLLRAGADVNARNDAGNTPEDEAKAALSHLRRNAFEHMGEDLSPGFIEGGRRNQICQKYGIIKIEWYHKNLMVP